MRHGCIHFLVLLKEISRLSLRQLKCTTSWCPEAQDGPAALFLLESADGDPFPGLLQLLEVPRCLACGPTSPTSASSVSSDSVRTLLFHFGPPQMIQGYRPISRSSTSLHLQVPFAAKLTYSWVPGIRTQTRVGTSISLWETTLYICERKKEKGKSCTHRKSSSGSSSTTEIGWPCGRPGQVSGQVPWPAVLCCLGILVDAWSLLHRLYLRWEFLSQLLSTPNACT